MAKKKFKERTPDEERIGKFMRLGFERHKKQDFYGGLEIYDQAFEEFGCIREEILMSISDCKEEQELNKDSKPSRELMEHRRKLIEFIKKQRVRLHALEQDKARVYLARAILNYAIGRYSKVLEDCSAVIKLRPRDVLAYEHRGLAKHALKDYDGAMKDFNTALRLYPKDRNILADRAKLKIKLGKVPSAMMDFAKAIRCSRASKYPIWESTAYVNRGCGFILLKKYLRALDDFNKALSLDKNSASAYYHRGYCEYLLGDMKRAKLDCGKANSLVNAFPKLEDAIKFFQKVN